MEWNMYWKKKIVTAPVPVKLTFTNKGDTSTNITTMGKKVLVRIWKFVHYWGDCEIIQPLWKPVWSFLRKLKLPRDPANFTSGNLFKRTESMGELKA